MDLSRTTASRSSRDRVVLAGFGWDRHRGHDLTQYIIGIPPVDDRIAASSRRCARPAR